jgi:hypothetical protein
MTPLSKLSMMVSPSKPESNVSLNLIIETNEGEILSKNVTEYKNASEIQKDETPGESSIF